MRITESRMMEVAARAVSQARDQVAEASDVMSSGIKVERPSQDPVGWAEGMRTQVRKAMSEQRSSTTARAREALSDTDAALAGVGDSLTQVQQLAVQMSSGTYSAQDRADAAVEVRALRDAALASANQKGSGGEYVLAGSKSDQPPFDASGAYQGDGVVRDIDVSEVARASVSVPGTVLTAASGGVDVFGSLDALATALDNNDVAGIQSSLASLGSAVDQVAAARAKVGGRMQALDQAASAQQSFQQALADAHSKAVEADPVAAASNLAQLSTALQGAQTVATQIIRLAGGGSGG